MMNEALQNKHFPLFSIITITLNNYDGLMRTWESLKNQTFEDFEWLVIDGGSTDETVQFLRSRRSATRTAQNPFRFVSEKDDGIYDAMNTGIELARGHYLLFLNAGDALAEANILTALAPICEESPGFIYGDAFEQKPETRKKPVTTQKPTPHKTSLHASCVQSTKESLDYTGKPCNDAPTPLKKGSDYVKSNTRHKPAYSHEDIAKGMFTHHQAMLYRRHIVRDTKLRYSLRFKIASDYDFTARFLRECGEKGEDVHYIDKPICIFELGGVSQQNAWLGRKEQYIIREQLEMLPLPENLWILLIQTLAWELKSLAPWLYHLLKKRRNTVSDR